MIGLILISCKFFLHLYFITTSPNNRCQLNDMIYDPIPSVKLVQNILPVVGNYEPIMGICGKMFIIDLHNLQMLFML